MGNLDFYERMTLRPLLKSRLTDLYSNGFEDFFQRLMGSLYPDFVDVRTAGQLGDQSSDGLGLLDRKLYACYGPQVYDAKKVEDKFWGDLEGAKEKRSDEFDVFVFVHNETRGVHPTISSLLATARDQNPSIKFEIFGFTKFHTEFCKLTRDVIEDILGFPLPLEKLVVSIATEELAPLLEDLKVHRRTVNDAEPISIPSEKKLNYNDFSDEQRDELRREFYLAGRIEKYYGDRVDITERDEVAASFRDEYVRLLEERDDLDSVVFGLEQYVLGNASVDLITRRCATAIIGFFFQQCDIFENPPTDWPG